MDPKQLVALGGFLIAAMSVEFNDSVTSTLLADIGGGLGFSHDPGTWFTSLYVSAEIVGMTLSPWFLVTISLRRWGVLVIAATALVTVSIPTTTSLSGLYVLRTLQGLCEGLTIPMLMTTALRALGPSIRLYGLAAYALSSTFFPSLASAVGALWMGTGDGVLGWQLGFYEALPLSLLAGSLVWWGLPQDPPHYERFRHFDWRGACLVIVGFGALSTMLQQGDRLDWFNSPLITALAIASAFAIPLLVLNEWFAELPLLKLQLLGRRNLAFGLIALFTFIIVALAGSSVPSSYLQQVQFYRPAQSFVLTAEIAASQLVLLPLVAILLDHERVDARVINFIGLVCMIAGAVGCSFLTSVWTREQFYLWQGVTSVGEAMVVMSLLLLATNAGTMQDGPFIAALINTSRALAEATGTWLLQLVDRWRGALHSSRLTDQAGQERYAAIQAEGVLRNDPAPLLPNGHPRLPGSLAQFSETITHQTQVLTLSDTFLVLAAVAGALMVVVLLLPVRTFPPRVALAQS